MCIAHLLYSKTVPRTSHVITFKPGETLTIEYSKEDGEIFPVGAIWGHTVALLAYLNWFSVSTPFLMYISI